MADKFSESGKMENLTLQIITPKETKQPLALRKELHKTLKPIFNKPLTNKHDGRVAYISSKKVGKIASKDAINTSLKNGFTQEQHFQAAKHLKELYENAYLREIQPDKQGEKNLQIPRYEAKFTLDGQVAIAKITLKETLTGLYKGNKIYTLELESVARLPSEP